MSSSEPVCLLAKMYPDTTGDQTDSKDEQVLTCSVSCGFQALQCIHVTISLAPFRMRMP